MAYVLYQNGKKIGEVREWQLKDMPAEVRNVLGKEILMKKPKDQCTFISPKPVERKSRLTMICDGKTELVLQQTFVKDGTVVTATVLESKTL